jgi:hypothetical protein
VGRKTLTQPGSIDRGQATRAQGGGIAVVPYCGRPAARVSTALDPSAVTSVLDLNPIADSGTVVSTGTIRDLGEMLTSLMP